MGVYITTYVLLVLLLLVVVGVKPIRSNISKFELYRRAKAGDGLARRDLDREQSFVDLVSLQRALGALLLVVSSSIGLIAYGLVWGSIFAIIVAVEAGALARLWPFRPLARSSYVKLESKIIHLTNKFPKFFKFIRVTEPDSVDFRINSKEELVHILSQSEGSLTSEESKLIQGGLLFGDKSVSEIMVPKSKVSTIRKSEILGPVVLNDLHNIGHSYFPVINKDINHIVGILNVKNLLIINGDLRSSSAAETVMDKSVYKINQNEKLETALAIFLQNKCHILIVENRSTDTVGILTFRDLVEAFFGRDMAVITTEDED